MSDDGDTNCFVSRCVCGGITFASVDVPERRKSNAKEVAALIRAGRKVENMPVREVQKSKFCFDFKIHESAAGLTDAVTPEPR